MPRKAESPFHRAQNGGGWIDPPATLKQARQLDQLGDLFKASRDRKELQTIESIVSAFRCSGTLNI